MGMLLFVTTKNVVNVVLLKVRPNHAQQGIHVQMGLTARLYRLVCAMQHNVTTPITCVRVLTMNASTVFVNQLFATSKMLQLSVKVWFVTRQLMSALIVQLTRLFLPLQQLVQAVIGAIRLEKMKGFVTKANAQMQLSQIHVRLLKFVIVTLNVLNNNVKLILIVDRCFVEELHLFILV
jgi:hypothetical protein